MKQQRGLTLVRPIPDRDMVETLRDLLEQAENGKIVGMAYVVLNRGNGYSGDVVGRARETPLLARGLVSTLWEQIPVLVKLK